MSDCLFCKIAAGDIPADILYEDDEMVAFRDLAPQAPQHFLVIPKKHIENIAGMTGADDLLVGKMMRTAAKVASEIGVEGDFRIVTNTGKEAGQEVFHLHLHVLGGRKMLWPPG